MNPDAVAYAREIFTDLVVATTLKAGKPPNHAEAKVLAEEAVSMARIMGAAAQAPPEAQVRVSVELQGHASGADTFANVFQRWIERAVKRSAGKSRQHLISKFRRYVLPRIGQQTLDELEAADILSVLRVAGDNYLDRLTTTILTG